jgi:alkanesulfonate monooxygenase SsuD/methylene tetrahydromethanopterin reductase-like flavin-dependent oxidoreductase (luciferase family)
MPSQNLPAISLVAVPGRRRQTLDIAREVEWRGFAGIYIPSRFGNMAQCTALALAIEHIPFGTAIAPIYARTAEDFAQSAAYLHEVSGRPLPLWHRHCARTYLPATRRHPRQAPFKHAHLC